MNLGHEEYSKGKHKITKDIFEGKDKTQNAELFLENLTKTKQRHLEEKAQHLEEKTQPTSAKREEEEKSSEPADQKADAVIMDLDPSQFAKKDQIFMDFFSIYGKAFIESKKGDKSIVKPALTTGKHTPFN